MNFFSEMWLPTTWNMPHDKN